MADIDTVVADDVALAQTGDRAVKIRAVIGVFLAILRARHPQHSDEKPGHADHHEGADQDVPRACFHLTVSLLQASSAARPRTPLKYSWIQGFWSRASVSSVPTFSFLSTRTAILSVVAFSVSRSWVTMRTVSPRLFCRSLRS